MTRCTYRVLEQFTDSADQTWKEGDEITADSEEVADAVASGKLEELTGHGLDPSE